MVGLDDKRSGKDAFIGSSLDPALLRARIYELTSPGRQVRLVLVDVPEGIGRPRRCLPIQDQLLTRNAAAGDVTTAVSQRTVCDIRPEAMATAREFLKPTG